MAAKVLLKRTNVKDKGIAGANTVRELSGYLSRLLPNTASDPTVDLIFYCKRSDADALIPNFFAQWRGIKSALSIKEWGNAVVQEKQDVNVGIRGLSGDPVDLTMLYGKAPPEAYLGLVIRIDTTIAVPHYAQSADFMMAEYPIDPKFRVTLQIEMPGPITVVDYGELALNYNSETPALYAKASDGSTIKWEGNAPPIRLATDPEATALTDGLAVTAKQVVDLITRHGTSPYRAVAPIDSTGNTYKINLNSLSNLP